MIDNELDAAMHDEEIETGVFNQKKEPCLAIWLGG